MRSPQPATSSGELGRSPMWQTLVRHQLGAIISTAVDFGTMVLLVEVWGASPVLGTSLGASLGAVSNFGLGRQWIFRGHSGVVGWQAVRYGAVSVMSAGWNAFGEHLMHDLAHVQYVVARTLVAIAVSVAWNFPMQRRFVFAEGKAHEDCR
jgi:putative flippase GtrA